MSESDNNDKKDNKSEDSNDSDVPPTGLVWTVRAIATFVLFGLIGYLLHLSSVPMRGPSFALNVDYDKIRVDGRFMTPVTIVNESTIAIASITVETTYGGDTYQTIIPLLGEGESATFEVVTDTRPEQGEIQPIVRSYLNF